MRNQSDQNTQTEGYEGNAQETAEAHSITNDAKMRAEAERLIAEGKMPPLDEVLRAMDEARAEYRQKLLEMRRRKTLP